MTKCFCDICGKEIILCPNYVRILAGEKDTEDILEICKDCEQAIRACIGNRKAKAERVKNGGM